METRKQSPIFPAVIVVLLLALLVFMLVSRKSQPGDSHPQSTTQDRCWFQGPRSCVNKNWTIRRSGMTEEQGALLEIVRRMSDVRDRRQVVKGGRPSVAASLFFPLRESRLA